VISDVQTVSEQTRKGPVGQETGENSLSRKEEVLVDLDSTVIIKGPVIGLVHNRTTLDDLGNPGVIDTTQKAGRGRYGWGSAGKTTEECGRVSGSAEKSTNSRDAAKEIASSGSRNSVGHGL
jgi:hypothetical protein